MAANGGSGTPSCHVETCDLEAAFYVYDADDEGWWPVCDRHIRERHPSLERHAWIDSGYLRPVALGSPSEAPGPARTERERAMRQMVAEAMDWTDDGRN